ncbi:site-specific integrase [Halomonas sp. MES3-P3E]|uniref:site-specific integrase n=1 Tax=Halomonas sp. MES3-P3E TaxID=2058321 RepID=UPI000C33E8B7|nr:integrase [Halomonas sp. MES3-P3E]PKG50192.1 integrase [Halomonas sp. MES3-P3E]
MKTRSRPRKHNPHIPAHIDQSRLPGGVYFDQRGYGRWYVLARDAAGRQRRKNIADAKATLSELHRITEEQDGIDKHSLKYLCERFHESAQCLALAAKTREDYEYCREALLKIPTKLGKPLGDLSTKQFSPALVQRLVDQIAAEGTPSKANHIVRYLGRVFRWGINRGYCETNPATGVEHAKERKQQRLPTGPIMAKLIAHSRERGNDYPRRGQIGSCPTYLWITMEIAYLCRLRGIEVVTLTDANITEHGLLTNRRKGSRDNIVTWSPRLREAIDTAQKRRADIWQKRGRAIPMMEDRRPLIVSRNGDALRKSSFDSAWQRFVTRALEQGIITQEERFSLHDLKRRGITDTKGNRHDKQQASGHRSASMMDTYDLSVPHVPNSGD